MGGEGITRLTIQLFNYKLLDYLIVELLDYFTASALQCNNSQKTCPSIPMSNVMQQHWNSDWIDIHSDS